MKSFLSSVFLVLLTAANSMAESTQYPVTIRGKPQVTMTKADISLADIADISSDNSEALLNLGKIKIGNSPNPGKSQQIAAQSILDTLRNNGVDLNKVGYSFYPYTNIGRASRELSVNEAQAAIESLILAESPDLKIKQISVPDNSLVFTGPATLTAQLKSQSANARVYSLQLVSTDSERLTVDVKAEIESWKRVPVATKDLAAGSILEAIDFGMARLNSKDLAKNVAFNPEQLIGKQLQQNINQGDTFKLPGLQKAIEIKSGARVQMVYNGNGLTASARGIAMQDGETGDLIEVKNDSSRQIVLGRIKDKSTVEVMQ